MSTNIYHPYPGKEGTFSFQTKAPMAPGRYALRWWLDLGNGCDPGKSALAPNEEVGLVIVQ